MRENTHATLVILGDRGVLITGPSGSGKSSLALALIDTSHGFAKLVSDDRVLVETAGPRGALIGRAPHPIAGQIEVHGLGIASHGYEPSAVIDLIVDLVEPDAVERMPDFELCNGVMRIRAPRRSISSARQLVTEALRRLNSGV